MPELVLTVRVHEAALRETGDASSRIGENVINVALLWPRPGKDEVLGTTGLVALTDRPGDDAGSDRPPTFAAPVLKERVEGDVAMLVHVLERDATGAFARLLRRLGSEAMSGLTGAVGGGIVRHVFTEAIEEGSVIVGEGEDERLDAVAVSEAPIILTASELAALAASGEPRMITVPLLVPRRLEHAREKGRLAPLRANGRLVLDVRVDRG